MKTLSPLHTTIELNVGDRTTVQLPDASSVEVAVLGIDVRCGTVRTAIRSARVLVQINGHSVWVPMAGYNLPRPLGGVQIDCPAIRMLANKREDVWKLERDVRLRLWPENASWVEPGTMCYPARQRWFATDTQMCNEPCFVGGAEYVSTDRVYYHDGLDIGGSEGDTALIAAADGILLAVGEDVHPRAADYEMQPRYDRVFLLDGRDWVHIYSHVKTFAPGLQPGMSMKMGEPIGLLGKEGTSGGWSHLHYGIKARQPNGQLTQNEGYAFLWQTYVEEYRPAVIAVARPHHFVRQGESVELDGSKSWAAHEAGVHSYRWRFSDGTEADGACVQHTYKTPGVYSEILTVRDSLGNEAVDFAVVQVVDRYEPEAFPPGIHAAYHPT
ncbi:MAG: peptidoglycan DD-metalloendopeptidase family protein, partial [Lentisphaeria bacterium]|nr:peptidoglycan DD-metalloendopeptidase family protein [Lentisphaeria bacterium]